MEIPDWAWAVSVGAFLAMEAVAIRNKIKGDTASEVIRRIAGIKPARPWKPLGVAAIAGFCAWLANHLIIG